MFLCRHAFQPDMVLLHLSGPPTLLHLHLLHHLSSLGSRTRCTWAVEEDRMGEALMSLLASSSSMGRLEFEVGEAKGLEGAREELAKHWPVLAE